jgi:hypothetical protein
MEDKIFYNPKIETTEKNLPEARKEFEKIRKEAPKVTDHLNKTVEVRHKFSITDKKINLGDEESFAALIAKIGLNSGNKVIPQDKEENKTEISFNNN